ncbi:hypothetical protein NKR23_g9894 [Pleurostoma richardsiae]|uniref:Uncharacterized protein n=1 Tax=Pleurostoma richardsiae TaxID=41990 RepID=A0AA38R6C0_9PEZI|nr:hypothetical protein NKR23_g9894 [Pleurostoma richardsiae]
MSGGPGFAPLDGSHDHYETGISGFRPEQGHTTTEITSGVPAQNFLPQGYYHPNQYPGGYGAAGAAGGAAGAAAGTGAYMSGSVPSPHMSPDQVPLTHDSREFDDFSRGFHDALGRIGEEDEDEVSGSSSGNLNGNGMNSTGDLGEGSSASGGVRPLWQQNLRQSRNMMWM